MNRIDELTFKWVDGNLDDHEFEELQALCASDPEHLVQHNFLLRMELALREDLNMDALAQGVVQSIESMEQVAFTESTMAQIKAMESNAEPDILEDPVYEPPLIKPKPFVRKPKRTPAWQLWIKIFAITGSLATLTAACWVLFLQTKTEEAPSVAQPAFAMLDASFEAPAGSAVILRDNKPLKHKGAIQLREGDTIQVHASNDTGIRPAIQYSNEATRVSLHPGARLKLLAADAGKIILLEEGKAEAIVAPQPEGRPFTVETPYAKATIVGTQFAIVANEDQVKLDVTEGAILMKSLLGDKMEAMVAAGQFVTVSSHGALTEPMAILQDLVGSPKGLISHWSFDDVKQNRIVNQVSGEGDVQLTSQVKQANGIQGKAMHLNGMYQYAKTPHKKAFELEHFTLSLWFKADKISRKPNKRHMLFGKGSVRKNLKAEGPSYEADPGQFHLGVKYDTRRKQNIVFIHSRYLKDENIFMNHPIELGQWYHIAVTVETEGLKAYINGELDSVSSDDLAWTQNASEVMIGAMNGLYYRGKGREPIPGIRDFFRGSIDEVSLYDSVLSPETIRELAARR